MAIIYLKILQLIEMKDFSQACSSHMGKDKKKNTQFYYVKLQGHRPKVRNQGDVIKGS